MARAGMCVSGQTQCSVAHNIQSTTKLNFFFGAWKSPTEAGLEDRDEADLLEQLAVLHLDAVHHEPVDPALDEHLLAGLQACQFRLVVVVEVGVKP